MSPLNSTTRASSTSGIGSNSTLLSSRKAGKTAQPVTRWGTPRPDGRHADDDPLEGIDWRIACSWTAGSMSPSSAGGLQQTARDIAAQFPSTRSMDAGAGVALIGSQHNRFGGGNGHASCMSSRTGGCSRRSLSSDGEHTLRSQLLAATKSKWTERVRSSKCFSVGLA